MSEITDAERSIAAKNRAWEVIRQWRNKPMCDDETLAAMVVKAVEGSVFSASEAAVAALRDTETGPT